jgi:hypothetical protein
VQTPLEVGVTSSDKLTLLPMDMLQVEYWQAPYVPLPKLMAIAGMAGKTTAASSKITRKSRPFFTAVIFLKIFSVYDGAFYKPAGL